MKLTKTLTTAIAATTICGALGIAYAQSSDTTAPPSDSATTQSAQPMPQPMQDPSATTPDASQSATTPSSSSQDMSPSTQHKMTPNPSSSDSSTSTPLSSSNDSSTSPSEPAPKADRG